MDFAKKKDLILKGHMPKVIMTLALPLMANNLIQTVYNLTDTYWISKLGSIEVAAITLVWPLIFFSMSLAMGINIASTALISQYVGSGQKQKAAKIAGQALSFSAIFSLILGVIGYFLAPTIVGWMGGEGELLEKASQFLQIIYLGLPFMFTFFAYTSIKHGLGDTYTPMLFGGGSVLLNIILDPIFIFTLDLGMNGAAYATVLARSIFAIYAISTLFRKTNDDIRLHVNDLPIHGETLLKIAKIGLPSSIGQSTTSIGFTVLNGFIVSYGAATLAAFGIGNRINSLVLMPAMGIGKALATIVGQNLGADQKDRAKKAVHQSMFLAVVILGVGGVILFFLAPNVIGIFAGGDQEVIKRGTYYLQLISLSLPLLGFFQVFIGTFQGSGHTISAMIIMMGRLWAFRIPLIIIFKYFTNMGSNAIWYAMVLSNFLVCLVGAGIYMTGKWQHKIIKKDKAKKVIAQSS